MRRIFVLVFVIFSVCGAAAWAEEAETLTWDDLMPDGEDEALLKLYEEHMQSLYSSGPIKEGSAQDRFTQIGTYNVVEDLDGERVRIPGFMVPLDFNAGMVSEFLLVPYFGACIHEPPPPPNQIIYVKSPKPIKHQGWLPIWAEGVLSAKRFDSEMGNAAYSLALEKSEIYE